MTFTSDVPGAPSAGPFNAVLWGLRRGLSAALSSIGGASGHRRPRRR
jgi:hypothetical protein